MSPPKRLLRRGAPRRGRIGRPDLAGLRDRGEPRNRSWLLVFLDQLHEDAREPLGMDEGDSGAPRSRTGRLVDERDALTPEMVERFGHARDAVADVMHPLAPA